MILSWCERARARRTCRCAHGLFGGSISTLLMGENGRCVSCCAHETRHLRVRAWIFRRGSVDYAVDGREWQMCQLLRTREKNLQV